MIIPVLHEHKDVQEQELREVQAAFLGGKLNEEQRYIVDACISWVIWSANQEDAKA